ncbi:MAG: Uncharacterised protein [Prochlorococcus marinus str. MIT 9215]|nr:MAG: Uncharacterised protein [Prochlorococcus marinus str. MIT 9215]
MRRLLSSTFLCLSLAGTAPLALASEESSIPKSLLQQIRELLGLVQPVAAGGSRGLGSEICLIAPFLQPGADIAVVPVSDPMIITAQPLNELRLERDGKVLWRSVASSTTPVAARTPWPIAPLEPGTSVDLVLRPKGATGGDVVRIELQAADQEVMAANTALIGTLKRNREAWASALKQALKRDDQSLAIALLSSDAIPIEQKAQIKQIFETTSCQ